MDVPRRKVEKALAEKGFSLEERDHRMYFLVVDGQESGIYTKVSKGKKYRDLGDGLIKLMADQMHLTKRQFIDFVECSMSADDYVQVLRSRGLL